MKQIVAVIFLIVAGPLTLSAAPKFDAKTWRTLRTYDVRTLSKNFESHIGELVEVHFNFRGKDIYHPKPGWYQASIWQQDPDSRSHFADVKVMVSQKDLKAFKSVTTDTLSPNEMTIYGRVFRDSEAHYVFVRLIGRNVVLDAAGNATLTW